METVHSDHVTTRILQPGSETFRFTMPESSALLEVLRAGAERAKVELLPSADAPWDRLHDIPQHDEVGPAIEDLNQSLGDYLKEKHTTRDFGIELLRIFRVNNRWAIATAEMLTPRQILQLVNLKYEEYTLYRENSADPLPLDTAIPVSRGQVFEAQRDGRYGRVL